MGKGHDDFKKEFNESYSDGMYATGKIGVTVFVIVLVLTLLGGISGVIFTRTIGKAKVDAEREVFKSSVAYNEQASSFLAKSYNEYIKAESETDKKAVMEYVVMRYPNLDVDKIDNDTLQKFYIKCLNN